MTNDLNLKEARLEVLRDHKGPYGVGFNDIDTSAVGQRPIIVRPDRLAENGVNTLFGDQTAYQRIMPGWPFKRTRENDLGTTVHRSMLARAGFEYGGTSQQEWWSSDKCEQAKNRRRYFAYKRRAFGTLNSLINEALSAAPPEALRATRRFPIKERHVIYSIIARSNRALQLVETFPALILAIACWHRGRDQENVQRAATAFSMVQRGARLKAIAAEMDISMALAKVKPVAAGRALDVHDTLAAHPALLHAYLPASAPAQGRWLLAIHNSQELGPPFIEWAARNAAEIGRTMIEVRSVLEDISDWVRACYRASIPDYVWRAAARGYAPMDDNNADFINRPFSPDMSLSTVLALSEQWHHAVAEHGQEGQFRQFPEPWAAGGEVNGYEIEPITNTRDLYLEGRTMHHCVGTYSGEILGGSGYVYSVTKSNKKVATAEIRRAMPRPTLGQVRGRCNAQVPAEVTAAIKKWLRSQKTFNFPALSRPGDFNEFGNADDFAADVPF